MSCPPLRDFQNMKKLARFLAGLKSVKRAYEWQSETQAQNLQVFVDSDWAGCFDSRKSTFGGMIMLGKHLLRTWSATQATITLSCSEAEFCALVEAATRGIGLPAVLEELGVPTSVVELLTDSSSAKSFASKRGVGKSSGTSTSRSSGFKRP